jgi:thiamine-monophosphate kinase
MGIGDDCAVFKASNNKLLLATVDTLIEGVHFLRDYCSFFDLGWKALAVNLSDIASMGGSPTVALVSLGLPKKTQIEDVEDFYDGMKSLAKKYGVNIVGGDTVSSHSKIYTSVSLLGEVNKRNPIYRKGARIGDLIMATGKCGASNAGLKILKKCVKHISTCELKQNDPLQEEMVQKHLKPEPRIREGQIIAASGFASAMIDDSDGLAFSINEICRMSRVGARVYSYLIPKAEGVSLNAALYGGEDFELIFTCKRKYADMLAYIIKKKTKTLVSIIGEIVGKNEGVKLVSKNKESRILKVKGFDHFL